MTTTDYDPEKFSFPFINKFPGLPLPTNTISGLASIREKPQTIHGLCGGMCYAALDFFTARMPIPAVDKPPKPGSQLYNYLYRRQQDSLGFLYTRVLRYTQHMLLTRTGAQQLNYDEWRRLRALLNSGKPAVLGIIFEDARQSMLPWKNHQVLGYRYVQTDNDTYVVQVYDPNYKSRDVVVQIKETKAGQVPGVTASRIANQGEPKPIHSFFIVPYRFHQPPQISTSE